MKTIGKKLAFLPLFFFISLFIGCQEEINEINIGNEDDKILVADSYVASLMKSTSTKDGSDDNILDKASCFTIQLPVNVFVNGLEIIVNSEEDFDLIEKIFDEYYDDDDYLEYAFPIVIILSDYTEITIENKDQLEEYVAKCNNEDDDDIECVDFKYPLSYSIFNTNDNLFNTVDIHNDKEMYRFIHNLTADDIVSLNFPITLVYSNEDEVVINNMSELENALAAGAEFCDEDDDDDYGDDDFDLERLNNLLVKCPWLVHDVRRNNTNLTTTYVDYLMIFKEDSTVRVRARNGNVITGTWVTEQTDHGVMLKLKFDSFVDFTLEWFVHDIEYGRIKLITEGGNRIILEKKCDIVFDHTKERIENVLKECLWRVARLHVNGADNEVDYIGTPLKFFNNGVVKLRINGEFIQGTWEIIINNSGYSLKMYFDNYPDLNLHWRIDLLGDGLLKLTNENSELILKRFCTDNDDDIVFINRALIAGTWSVAYFEEDSINNTENFNGFILDFLVTGRVKVDGNNMLFSGAWLSYRNDGHLKLGLNFGDHDIFYKLNNRWKIIEINENRIELVDFSNDGSIEKKLVLERN